MYEVETNPGTKIQTDNWHYAMLCSMRFGNPIKKYEVII